MSNVSSSEIKREFLRSKIGLAGVGILLCLIILSLIAVITIPIDTFKQWNNPGNWITYPKTSVPAWVNYFSIEKIPDLWNPDIKDNIIVDNGSVQNIKSIPESSLKLYDLFT